MYYKKDNEGYWSAMWFDQTVRPTALWDWVIKEWNDDSCSIYKNWVPEEKNKQIKSTRTLEEAKKYVSNYTIPVPANSVYVGTSTGIRAAEINPMYYGINCSNSFVDTDINHAHAYGMGGAKAQEKQGNNPMAKYNDYSANAAIVSGPSDAQVQRDYLLGRLATIGDGSSYYSTKNAELRKLFNIGVSNQPKTYKELIDAIKNDKFKLDEKRIKRMEEDREEYADEDSDYDSFYDFGGPFEYIIWDGPKPDQKGYDKAVADRRAAYIATKDAIMVKSADEALAALQAYENWKPETVTVH